MEIASSGALYDVLRQYGLLSRDQLADVPALAQGRCGDARSLCKLLIQRGWLTIYQANEILAGRANDLVVGPYNVLEMLGKGGLSQVYKARHVDYGWVVALKVLRAEAVSDDLGRTQFLREMEAMADMDHPNIVQFCDVDQLGETFYFAMEFVDGVDLGKHVCLSGPLPAPEACEYIRQAALGLQHAHERNLVHRDIKPVNLFLTQVPILETGKRRPKKRVPTRPLIKLLDWGLADRRLPNQTVEEKKSGSGVRGIIGTADYLSPEQARDAATVDIRGDLYSLGCTFYFLLTGQPPFPQGNLAQKLIQHQTAAPKPIEEFRQDVPVDVIQILRRMMEKKPQDRFATPAAVALALTPFTKGGGAVPPIAWKRQGERIGRHKDDTPLPAILERYRRPSAQGTAVKSSQITPLPPQ